jgi:hypothetical protein
MVYCKPCCSSRPYEDMLGKTHHDADEAELVELVIAPLHCEFVSLITVFTV